MIIVLAAEFSAAAFSDSKALCQALEHNKKRSAPACTGTIASSQAFPLLPRVLRTSTVSASVSISMKKEVRRSSYMYVVYWYFLFEAGQFTVSWLHSTARSLLASWPHTSFHMQDWYMYIVIAITCTYTNHHTHVLCLECRVLRYSD